MRYIVTGADGYLGRHVMAVAPAGTIGLKRLDVDLLDRAVTKATITADDIVIHCAAQVPKNAEDYKNNRAAEHSLMMVDNLAESKPHRIIYASSMTVYADDGAVVRKEEDAGGHLSEYGQGKLDGEELLHRSGIPYTALRLAGLFGLPRRSGLIYNAVMAIIKKTAISLPKESPLWAPLAVEDAADLCLRAAQYDTAIGPCNAGYTGSFSVSRQIEELYDHFAFGATLSIIKSEPVFEFDLNKLHCTFGKTKSQFYDRIDNLAGLIQ